MRLKYYKKYVSSGQKTKNVNYKVFLRFIIKKYFPKNKNTEILELGSGCGELLSEAKLLGYKKIKGVEISSEMLDQVPKNIKSFICRRDIRQIMRKEQSKKYDMIVAKDVLEHFSLKELGPLCKDIHRCLKNGGYFLAHVPNGFSIWGGSVFWSDITHKTNFTEKSINQLLKTEGFKNVEVFEDFPKDWSLKSFIRRLIWIVGSFPFRLLLAAETGSPKGKITQNIFFKAYS